MAPFSTSVGLSIANMGTRPDVKVLESRLAGKCLLPKVSGRLKCRQIQLDIINCNMQMY